MDTANLFYMDETGEMKKVAEVTASSLTPEPEEEDVPALVFNDAPIFSFKLTLSRKDQRFWLKKVFCAPKYEVTETLFPRKKKRGSMRRARKERK